MTEPRAGQTVGGREQPAAVSARPEASSRWRRSRATSSSKASGDWTPYASTNLDFILGSKGITTIVLGGILTNCCVESTMRSGYENGYQVVTLSDCVAATSVEEHDNAIAYDYPMFSPSDDCRGILQQTVLTWQKNEGRTVRHGAMVRPLFRPRPSRWSERGATSSGRECIRRNARGRRPGRWCLCRPSPSRREPKCGGAGLRGRGDCSGRPTLPAGQRPMRICPWVRDLEPL